MTLHVCFVQMLWVFLFAAAEDAFPRTAPNLWQTNATRCSAQSAMGMVPHHPAVGLLFAPCVLPFRFHAAVHPL